MFRPRMLSGRHLRVWEAQTVEDFKKEVVGFARSLEFNTVSTVYVIDQSATHTEFFAIDNVPVGYHQTFHDVNFGRRDPVMQHCKANSIPLVWDWRNYRAAGEMDIWEEQAAFGIRQGIALALHMPLGRHFTIGLDWNQSPTHSAGRLTDMIAEAQLFAVHANEAARRIFDPECLPGRQIELTPRELEALRWTVDGKSAREISDILNISERTVVFHLHNATVKLKCRNKFHACIKAMQLRILS